jgi:hypothetical protein
MTDVGGKRELRAGKQADGSVEVIHRSETSGTGPEVPRHQLLANFCRAVAYTV